MIKDTSTRRKVRQGKLLRIRQLGYKVKMLLNGFMVEQPLCIKCGVTIMQKTFHDRAS